MKIENVSKAEELRRELTQTDDRIKRLQDDRGRPIHVKFATDTYGSNGNTYQVHDPTLRELVYFANVHQQQKNRAALVAELKTLGVEVA